MITDGQMLENNHFNMKDLIDTLREAWREKNNLELEYRQEHEWFHEEIEARVKVERERDEARAEVLRLQQIARDIVGVHGKLAISDAVKWEEWMSNELSEL